MKLSDTCELLIDGSSGFHPLYGDRLANHLPMTLAALDQIGASPEQLQGFFEFYKTKLELQETSRNPVPIHSIDDALSHSDQFSGYVSYFTREIKAHGIENILKKSLPVLMPGLAASAFHAVIRLAYAVESNNRKEVAISLAYWASEYQEFHISTEMRDESYNQILTRLSPNFAGHTFSPGIIVDRMTEAADILIRKHTVLQPQEVNLPEVAGVCIDAYIRSKNFTLLHTVTGCHAARVIAPFLTNLDGALRHLWQAIVLAFLSTGLGY